MQHVAPTHDLISPTVLRLLSTILSSAANDGRIRLWKATAGNVWRPAGHISVEQADEHQPDVEMGDPTIAD